MSDKNENRGRKAKQVDATMFDQLILYYKEKPLNSVTECEKTLAEFMQQFTSYSVNFELMRVQYNEIRRANPRFENEEVYNALTEKNDNYFYVRLGKNPPTEEFFDDLRKGEKERVQLKLHHFSCYNVVDIYHANRYFQALKKDDAKKLMQRLRKMKHQRSKQFLDKKVGIELDYAAYNQIKSFINEYGFKTLSVGVLVMAEMACEYSDKSVSKMLRQLYFYERLKPENVFISNAETKRVEKWISKDQVYYSNQKYYLSAATFPDAEDEGCYAIDFDDATTIRQMIASNRAVRSNAEIESEVIGVFSKGEITTSSNKEDETLNFRLVRNLQGLLGGRDALKAYMAVEDLLEKWGLYETQKTTLLGFDPTQLNIDDKNAVHERLSLLLNIHEQLRVTFDNPSNTYGYMTKINYNAPYDGKKPIEVACEGVDGLKLVYNSLVGVAG